MRNKTVTVLLLMAFQVSIVPSASSAVMKDPVIQKITARINEIPIRTSNVKVDSITWILSPKVPANYKKALVSQNQSLANGFPNLFKWKGTALVLIGDPFTWTPPEGTLSKNCNRIYSQITGMWEKLPNLDGRVLAGTSYCDDHIIVIVRPDPSNPIPDADLMAQEFGGEIQENARYLNPSIATLDHGQLTIPNWFLQGSQSAIAFQVYVGERRTLSGAPSKAFVTPDCQTIQLQKLEKLTSGVPSNCVYTKGFASVQLMIAIYGWDATTRWFSGYTDASDYQGAFKKAYGDSLASFNKLADSYWKSLVNKKYVAKDVVARLKR
ncbi:unannotated protein [freshwater metagenome]|uniref:Unannotated protein n=1 Tax=freshwater metagenome TaxID=449393 RepID=A0A6J6KH89_9ZZZZ|nr:hypothetical protein [Actinomycetota bacterium]MSZ12956.1 hypothetical protein [Actinomycetota bacterium]MSZ28099.1 hypothetical protein [Actinomycetota bacterium]